MRPACSDITDKAREAHELGIASPHLWILMGPGLWVCVHGGKQSGAMLGCDGWKGWPQNRGWGQFALASC